MNSNIRIVLVSPSHPGNVGAVARAMKTMELNNLYLVSPKSFPHVDATARAAGADNLLEDAIVVNSLKDALEGVTIVFGTSARLRALSLPKVTPREAAKVIVKEKQSYQIAIIFGRENNGLSNEELELCNYHLYIPTNPKFNSLNLAQAVQLIAYELKIIQEKIKKNYNEIKISKSLEDDACASTQEVCLFYEHLLQTLVATEFLNQKRSGKVLSKLKLLFNRARLKKSEVNILRGILNSINKKVIK